VSDICLTLFTGAPEQMQYRGGDQRDLRVARRPTQDWD
jgi:hypothetical protein